ncbi:undecaprenyldiphospho-muramoylpentapeptide beta-N-acetylglucosaminyltransferase [Alcaligenaceae bacterium CGII-47]|nr:undecaprenyldiphospho-muramoylpentapeptide beta-N-acetylglucosaminyltransferase [Alcaligenaceae bacterium CGII-47]
MSERTIIIMAGGTGGHIMPGLAVAQVLRARGWRVLWLGHPDRMEGRLVPEHGFELLPLRFSGVRGKGFLTLLKLPFTLARACLQARQVLRAVKPDVVLGMGGYVAFPGGVMARLARIPLLVHEQNAVAGTANRYLARLATGVLTGFPGALPNALMVGNPVRESLLTITPVAQRYAAREGVLRVLILGGSLGAAFLNDLIPQALALLPEPGRPRVRHQTGRQHLESVRARYAEVGLEADITPFIDDMATAFSEADIVICRAGAMTVAEVAAAGVAALFVPLPHAIDDHQSANARYLSDCGGAWLVQQSTLSPQWLAQWLAQRNRAELAGIAQHAREHASLNAAQVIADTCVHMTEEPA